MNNSQAATEDSAFHYLVRQPKTAQRKPPVIILLHGVGSNEQDLFSFSDQLPDSFLVFSLRAPITMGQGSYAWYPVSFANGKPDADVAQAGKSRAFILAFIDHIEQTMSADAAQVYLCGFSQGAIMSYYTALTHPARIRGFAALSGRVLVDLKAQVTDSTAVRKLKVFIGHGTADNVLQVQYGRDAAAWLGLLGIVPVYKEYNEGHTICTEELMDVVNWLKGK